jgi:hypothetical protein
LKISALRHIDTLKNPIFSMLTFLVLIFTNSPFVFGQVGSISPFSSSLGDNPDASLSSSLQQNQQPQGEGAGFQPVFQAIDPKFSISSNKSSSIEERKEMQQNATSLGSSPGHPREPLTQYQTVVQTPARTLTVQPTTALPPATIYPPGISVPSTATTAGTNVFPQTTLAGTGTLPPSAVTFPPSVFPPTTSYIPPTSIAPVLGPLSPWFPSIPAIACGGTFSFSVVGALDRGNDDGKDDGNGDSNNSNGKDKNDNDNDKDKLYAIQIQSNGGSALDTDSIEGKVFAGEKNIEQNKGEDFDIKDVFNDCQVVTFSN